MSHYPEHYDCNHSKEGAVQCPACGDLYCPECEAHACAAARLIAAAPELLEAARAMMRVLDATAGGWKGRVADDCRAAIAKAEGDS